MEITMSKVNCDHCNKTFQQTRIFRILVGDTYINICLECASILILGVYKKNLKEQREDFNYGNE